ncbi:MAG: phosphoribosylformylglycinamidine synthase subunit PurQ, partial [Oscillospiraceae bacterium]
GRDGCGGATGSSKPHGEDSLASCGAEVQKGNAPEERKLQRLFRDRAASRMIKRCNDFGAGGVSVAVGELADGLDVNLDAVTKKYDGLDGTELAISESQERMAVVVEAGDAAGFIELAARENIEASVVATVTEQPHLVMRWNGAIICDVKRSFLDTNGAKKHADVVVNEGEIYTREMHGSFAERMQSLVGDLNVCSKKGLSERFDSTIGAASVLMPFGGRTQRTPSHAMAAKLPVGSESTTCSGMAWGFDPFVAEKSEYRGGYLAVVESVAKLVASGFERRNIYLTFQEYFKRLGNDPQRWGSPFASLLGALDAQLDLKVAAIGGKDSMSGSFENLDVPPTLVSFAVAAGNTGRVQSCEFKRAGSRVALISPDMRDALLPGAESLKKTLDTVEQIIANGKALSVYALGARGVAEAIFKMSLGNEIGFKAADDVSTQELFSSGFGSFLLELDGDEETGRTLGYTSGEYVFEAGEDTLDLRELERPYEDRLAPVFPFQNIGENKILSRADFAATGRISPKITVVRPRVLIPVFPGTNCELDSARAMNRAGANPTVYVIRNLTPADVERSVADVAHLVSQSEIVFLPGGFSGADEPEGSAKLIAAFFRNPVLTQAVRELLFERDGLMLGICNGFQALLKLGLLPFGDICETDVSCPTLTFNKIGRHQSKIVRTRIC